jgi:hypothetical protein
MEMKGARPAKAAGVFDLCFNVACRTDSRTERLAQWPIFQRKYSQKTHSTGPLMLAARQINIQRIFKIFAA